MQPIIIVIFQKYLNPTEIIRHDVVYSFLYLVNQYFLSIIYQNVFDKMKVNVYFRSKNVFCSHAADLKCPKPDTLWKRSTELELNSFNHDH